MRTGQALTERAQKAEDSRAAEQGPIQKTKAIEALGKVLEQDIDPEHVYGFDTNFSKQQGSYYYKTDDTTFVAFYDGENELKPVQVYLRSFGAEVEVDCLADLVYAAVSCKRKGLYLYGGVAVIGALVLLVIITGAIWALAI